MIKKSVSENKYPYDNKMDKQCTLGRKDLQHQTTLVKVIYKYILYYKRKNI